MATTRILLTVCAALFAALTLTLGSAALAPAAAQAAQDRPGRPLNLLPNLGPVKKSTRQSRSKITAPRIAASKPAHRVAQHHTTPARAVASRRSVRTVASRPAASPVPPVSESLGYQAEGKTQAPTAAPAPIDAWLRSPLPSLAPAADRTARPTAATARDRLDITSRSVEPETTARSVDPEISTRSVGPEPIISDAVSAAPVLHDAAPAGLTSEDTVQVADAGEINEIDLAADATPTVGVSETPAPADRSWLYNLLAVLGGCLAAAAAAGFLFRPRPAY